MQTLLTAGPKPLPDLSCKYGAPMGRRESHGEPEPGATWHIQRVELDSGGYDSGGAYWGIGAPLYRTVSTCGNVETFERFASRAAAEAQLRETYPDATIAGEPGADDFVAGYVAACLWASPGDDENETLDAFDCTDITPESREGMAEHCGAFMATNAALLAEACAREGYTWERAGHDLYLTENGHGVGFWDRRELAAGGLGDRLSKAAGRGETYLYAGEDGRLHFEGCTR